MSTAISELTVVVSSKSKSEGTLKGCVNQSETGEMKFKRPFQLVTFCTARNLSGIETLDLWYKGAIMYSKKHS